MGQVPEGLVLDLPVLAVGASQQVGLVDLSFVGPSCGGYMYCAVSAWHTIYSTSFCRLVKRIFIF